jgi:hypothetical protein
MITERVVGNGIFLAPAFSFHPQTHLRHMEVPAAACAFSVCICGARLGNALYT